MNRRLAVLIAGVGLVTSLPAGAFNPQPEPPGSPVLAVSSGERVQIHVLNSALRTDRLGRGLNCAAQMTLYSGSTGAVIKQATAVAGRGRAVSLAASSTEIGGVSRGQQSLVYAEVRFVNSSDAEKILCGLNTTSGAETVQEQTGVTNVRAIIDDNTNVGTAFILDDNTREILLGAVAIVDDDTRDLLRELLDLTDPTP